MCTCPMFRQFFFCSLAGSRCFGKSMLQSMLKFVFVKSCSSNCSSCLRSQCFRLQCSELYMKYTSMKIPFRLYFSNNSITMHYVLQFENMLAPNLVNQHEQQQPFVKHSQKYNGKSIHKSNLSSYLLLHTLFNQNK